MHASKMLQPTDESFFQVVSPLEDGVPSQQQDEKEWEMQNEKKTNQSEKELEEQSIDPIGNS